MTRSLALVLALAAIGSACTSPRPAPVQAAREQRAPPQAPRALPAARTLPDPRAAFSGDVDAEIDRLARRVVDIREQLDSADAEVVAWAAWRCANERVKNVEIDLVRARDLARVTASWRDSERCAERTAVGLALLDAHVQLGIDADARALAGWEDEPEFAGVLLVLRTRGKTGAVALDEIALHARLPLRVEVVDAVDENSRPPATIALADLPVRHYGYPPIASYEVHRRVRDNARFLNALPGAADDVGWWRQVTPEHRRSALKDSEETRIDASTWAAERVLTLGFHADRPPEMAELLHVVVDLSEPERAQRRVAYARADLDRLWRQALGDLERRGMLASENAATRPAPIVLTIVDQRSDTSTPLPEFTR